MNFRVDSKLVIGFIIFMSGTNVFASTLPQLLPEQNNTHNDECIFHECDEFFSRFAKDSGKDHVAYLKKKNRLVLFSCPSVMKDFLLGICVSMTTVAGGVSILGTYVSYEINDIGLAMVSSLAALVSFGFTAAMLYFIVKHHKMRHDFIPYLIFDSKGLQKFGDYVLEWNNVDKVDVRLIRLTAGHSEIVNSTTVYLDKFGDELFTLCDYDSLLPISYEKTKHIFRHCLSVYGNEKFKVA